MILARNYMCSLMMISDMLSKHVRAVKSGLKKWFKINDIQLVHLLVVWYLVNPTIQISWEVRQVEVELSCTRRRTDGRFDMMKLIIAFRDCFEKPSKAYKNIKKYYDSPFMKKPFLWPLNVFQLQWQCNIEQCIWYWNTCIGGVL